VIYEANELTSQFIQSCIADEVTEAGRARDVLRANSMASKVLKYYGKLIVGDYLKKVLAGPIKGVYEADSYEVDPTRLSKSENLAENQRRLKEACQKFSIAITESLPLLPVQIRLACGYIKEQVKVRFGSGTDSIIALYIMLRFIVPPLSDPESIVEEEPSTTARRNLVLIAKILSAFGREEFPKGTYMAEMNDLLWRNKSAFDKFIKEIPMNSGKFVYSSIPKEQSDFSLKVVHAITEENKDLLKSEPYYNKLETILKELGPPSPRAVTFLQSSEQSMRKKFKKPKEIKKPKEKKPKQKEPPSKRLKKRANFDPNALPALVDETVKYIMQRGLKEEGIFRVSASLRKTKEIRDIYDVGDSPPEEEMNVHLAAGLLKQYLREKKPLIDPSLQPELEAANKLTGDEQSTKIAEILGKLPSANGKILESVFPLLVQVLANSEHNKMNIGNICIIFCPLLGIEPNDFNMLLHYYKGS